MQKFSSHTKVWTKIRETSVAYMAEIAQFLIVIGHFS